MRVQLAGPEPEAIKLLLLLVDQANKQNLAVFNAVSQLRSDVQTLKTLVEKENVQKDPILQLSSKEAVRVAA